MVVDYSRAYTYGLLTRSCYLRQNSTQEYVMKQKMCRHEKNWCIPNSTSRILLGEMLNNYIHDAYKHISILAP